MPWVGVEQCMECYFQACISFFGDPSDEWGGQGKHGKFGTNLVHLHAPDEIAESRLMGHIQWAYSGQKSI